MSESLRNDGRIWVPQKPGDDRDPTDVPENERDHYLERMYPAFGNLAPRDVSSRAARAQIDAGHGVGPLKNSVYLDFRDALERLGQDTIAEHYGNRRIALLFVTRLGRSSLGLAYGMTLTDLILAPATPSNTARCGGVVYPIVASLSRLEDSHPEPEESRKRYGHRRRMDEAPRLLVSQQRGRQRLGASD